MTKESGFDYTVARDDKVFLKSNYHLASGELMENSYWGFDLLESALFNVAPVGIVEMLVTNVYRPKTERAVPTFFVPVG